MKPPKIFVGALALIVLLIGHLAAQSGESNAKSFVWKQCNENVLTLELDPKPLQEFVGSDFSVRLVNGKARVLIIVQDCHTSWINGEDTGHTQEVREWMAIDGPLDVRPVPGAQRTLPTLTWFALFVGSSSAHSRELWELMGTAAVRIDSLSLNAPGPKLSGQVSAGPSLSYSGEAQPVAPVAHLVAVNHNVYIPNGGGKLVFRRIQGVANVVAWNSPGTLKVVGATSSKKLIGFGTYTIMVHAFRPVWVLSSPGGDARQNKLHSVSAL